MELTLTGQFSKRSFQIQLRKKKWYAKMQEGVCKDVEHVFGVLQV
jgi:hypothetical protein